MTYSESDLVATIERLTGRPIGELSQADRDRIDQYHAGGREAVDRLVPGLRLEAGRTVLDVGSGFGGPARQVARLTRATVVGVDIAEAYVQAAQALTEDALITFVCSDIAGLERTDFDAAYTMHVQMNIGDKLTFFRDIGRHLRPGARLAIFEVCRGANGQPSLPLPWSLDGTDSHLASADELRDTIRAAGFNVVEWTDDTGWIREWFGRIPKGGAGDAVATLPAILDDGPLRMMNFAAGVAQGSLTLHRGLFTRVA